MHPAVLRPLAVSRRAVTVAARPATTSTLRAYATSPNDPQLGDYPQVPDVSRQLLPPTGWWDNQLRRNFGDIPHPKEELYSMWGPDVPKLPPRTALFQFCLSFAMFGSIMAFAYAVTPERPAAKRAYPYGGLVKELGGLEENKAVPESVDMEN